MDPTLDFRMMYLELIKLQRQWHETLKTKTKQKLKRIYIIEIYFVRICVSLHSCAAAYTTDVLSVL